MKPVSTVREYVLEQIQKIPFRRPAEYAKYSLGLAAIIQRSYSDIRRLQEDSKDVAPLVLDLETRSEVPLPQLPIPYCPLLSQFYLAYAGLYHKQFLQLMNAEGLLPIEQERFYSSHMSELRDLGTLVSQAPQAARGDIVKMLLAGFNTALRTVTMVSAYKHGLGQQGGRLDIGDMTEKLAHLPLVSLQLATTFCGLTISPLYPYNFNLFNPRSADGLDEELLNLLKTRDDKSLPGKCPAAIARVEKSEVSVVVDMARSVESYFLASVTRIIEESPESLAPHEFHIFRSDLPRIDLDSKIMLMGRSQ